MDPSLSLPQVALGGDGALRLAVVLAFTPRLALVVFALSLRDRDLDLGPTFVEVDRQRDDRVATLLDLVLDLQNLGLVQQQLAFATRGMVVPGAVRVFGDVHGVEPGLPTVDEGVA